MAEPVAVLVSFSVGLLAGCLFFGGLWWTISRVVTASWPKRLLLQSFLIRTAVALFMLYFTAGDDFFSFGAYILGFVAARTVALQRPGRYIRLVMKGVGNESHS